jgi:hypothetical protein
MIPVIAHENSEAAKAAIQRWYELKTDRHDHEAMWEDIARLIRPQRGGFKLDDHRTRDHEKPLSSAPIHAHGNFAAGLYGTLTNPANRWFGFRTDDEDLNNWHPMRQWLDMVSRRVLASFLPSTSTFYTSAIQVFSDMAAFGNAAQYEETDLAEKRILDITLSLAEVCFDIDAHGQVCEVVRKFKLKPMAAVRAFQGKGRLPGKLEDMAAKGNQDEVTFYQHVLKNDQFTPGRLGAKGKRWLSRWVCEVDYTIVREAGYARMPFYAPRWEVDSGQIYGVGPGFVALASARTHNRMEEAVIRAAQRAADPTILAPDRQDFPLHGRLRPGALVYGAVDPQGRALVRPLEAAGGINLTLQERQAKIEEMRDAFHYTLLQLAGRTGMTATEVMAITEERQRLWAPHQGRVQEEWLQPKISARFEMLWAARQLPPPPKGLPEGLALSISYESAAAAAQKSVEGNAALRIIQDIAPLLQVKPRLADRIDEDGLLEVLAEARGAPARILRSREDADQMEAARQQQQQALMALQAAQAGAGAMKDMATAGAQLAGAGQGGAA